MNPQDTNPQETNAPDPRGSADLQQDAVEKDIVAPDPKAPLEDRAVDPNLIVLADPKSERPRRKLDPLFLFGAIWLAVLIFGTVIGRFVLPDPLAAVYPIHSPAGTPGHPFGTDEIGRDILARVVGGAFTSLTIGLTVQLIVIVIGVLVGVLGEFGPKWVSVPLLRLTDGMFAFPDILLAILIVGIFKVWLFPALPVIVALAVAGWPTTARLVKTQCASLRDREYVVAARAAGAGVPYLIFRHILPQLVGILLAVSVVELSGTILSESTLSFLGIGVPPPTPTWGAMINTARGTMQSYPSELAWPCLALTLTILALNFVGDGLRDRFDPRRG